MAQSGGRFDFDDGGTYCGSWEEGRANGYGVCTGPGQKGEFAGMWHFGFEVTGVYTWPNGGNYAGQWQNGRRHGFGIERRQRSTYSGEWNQGKRGRYGKREHRSSGMDTVLSTYLGTWHDGLNDGYGTETYADGGTYVGQWQRSLRHGYGIRRSAPFSSALRQRAQTERHASMSSLRSYAEEESPASKATEPECVDGRAGFVLRARSDAPSRRRRSLSERSLAVKRTILSNLRIKKQHSTGDIHQKVTSMTGSLRSSGSLMSCTSDESEHARPVEFTEPEERVDPGTVELYRGEWKNDQRYGFGICERTDGLKYVGEWAENRKNGYGITYFKDGTKEEGRYKNNVLVCSTRRKGLLFVRPSRIREKVEQSVEAANRAASIATQKADIASSRTATAKERADTAEQHAEHAEEEMKNARITATQYDPSFVQPGIQILKRKREHLAGMANHVSFDSVLTTQPQRAALGDRLTRSYQQLQVGNHQGTHPSGPGASSSAMQSNHVHHGASNRASDQLGDYSRSFDYPGQSSSAKSAVPNVNAGHYEVGSLADYSDRNMHSATAHQKYSLPQQQQYAPSGMPDRPAVLHQTVSAGNASLSAAFDDHRVNEGASTSSVSRLAPDSRSTASASIRTEMSPSVTPLRRARPGGGSIMSLSDDHYDQYRVNRNASDAGDGPTRLRRNRPSLTRQSEVNTADPIGTVLNRRSTLATARDRRDGGSLAGGLDRTEDRGSLPNLVELEGQGVTLHREDAARLASQRRQETQRLLEEEEMLRANPLRYFFHPALRAWLLKWKVPLILVLANFFLLYVLFRLLTFERSAKTARSARGEL